MKIQRTFDVCFVFICLFKKVPIYIGYGTFSKFKNHYGTIKINGSTEKTFVNAMDNSYK